MGLKVFQADSLATFPLQLGPQQARDGDGTFLLPCFGEHSPKLGKLE